MADGASRIYIRPDLTKAQQELDKKLREEWLIAGKDTHKIFRNRIIPRNASGADGPAQLAGNSEVTPRPGHKIPLPPARPSQNPSSSNSQIASLQPSNSPSAASQHPTPPSPSPANSQPVTLPPPGPSVSLQTTTLQTPVRSQTTSQTNTDSPQAANPPTPTIQETAKPPADDTLTQETPTIPQTTTDVSSLPAASATAKIPAMDESVNTSATQTDDAAETLAQPPYKIVEYKRKTRPSPAKKVQQINKKTEVAGLEVSSARSSQQSFSRKTTPTTVRPKLQTRATKKDL